MLPTCAFDTPAQFPCRQLRFLPPDDAAVVAGNFVDFKSACCQSAPFLLRIILPPQRAHSTASSQELKRAVWPVGAGSAAAGSGTVLQEVGHVHVVEEHPAGRGGGGGLLARRVAGRRLGQRHVRHPYATKPPNEKPPIK